MKPFTAAQGWSWAKPIQVTSATFQQASRKSEHSDFLRAPRLAA